MSELLQGWAEATVQELIGADGLATASGPVTPEPDQDA
jgi:hypothetical protein